jgi:hypothetical protein
MLFITYNKKESCFVNYIYKFYKKKRQPCKRLVNVYENEVPGRIELPYAVLQTGA